MRVSELEKKSHEFTSKVISSSNKKISNNVKRYRYEEFRISII